MNSPDMRRIIDEIVVLGDELRRLNELTQRAKPAKPADPAALSTFGATFAGKVPPSFLQLLSIYDGVENFDYVDISIFGCDYLLQNASELEEEWVDAEMFEEDEIFVFARSDIDSIAVAFALNKPGPNGEMGVIYFDARGVGAEFENLEAYLVACKRMYEHNLTKEAADRAGFSSDD
jgi:hypothetical protein